MRTAARCAGRRGTLTSPSSWRHATHPPHPPNTHPRRTRERDEEWRSGFARERLGKKRSIGNGGRRRRPVATPRRRAFFPPPPRTPPPRSLTTHAPTQTPPPTLWSFQIIARLPPRRYACCGNAPRAAPSLLLTKCKPSRSRCLGRVERAWLVRPVAGYVRVGWWVLVLGRVGRGRPLSTIPSLTPPTHAPPRARPSPSSTTAITQKVPCCKHSKVRRELVLQRQRGRHEVRCAQPCLPQLGVAVNEKRRTLETVCPLVCGRKREQHAHSLTMARVDTLQRLGERWISTSSI